MDIELHEVELVPERTLGTAPLAALTGRLAYGWAVDRSGAEAGPGGRPSCRLMLVCTFKPEGPESKGAFRSASLGLSLHASADNGSQPIARLIEPAERTRPVNPSRTGPTTINLGINAGPVTLGVEHAVSGSQASEEWIVRGYGTLQPTPTWDFRATKCYPLIGDYPVETVIDLIHGVQNTADVLLAAEVEHRQFGIRKYRAQLSPDLTRIALQQ